MATYETLVIVRPDLAEDDERAALESLAQIVTDGGGSLLANDPMGRRRLAYPIDKCEDGVYARYLYDAEPAVPTELERRTRLSDKVLRTLTVRLERDWAAAAKEQAIVDARRREEAAAQAVLDEAAAAEAKTKAKADESGEESAGAERGSQPEDGAVDGAATPEQPAGGAEEEG